MSSLVIRKICENLFLCHARSEIFQYIVNRDAHSANARLPAALTRLNGNDVLVTHVVMVTSQSYLIVEDIQSLFVEVVGAFINYFKIFVLLHG